MSTGSVSSSNSAYLLSSMTGSQSVQITGLASGLNTNQIIAQEMAIYSQPVIRLQNVQSRQQATNTALSSIQSELQTLSSNAVAAGNPALFVNTQAVTTSDPTKLTASTASGAGVGGYQVTISQLANSSQRTFTFASPATNPDTFTIDGTSVTVPAGQSISDFVSAINSNSNLDVYAATTNSNTVVLSTRTTGSPGASYITVQDTGGTLTEQTALAKPGQNALYAVNGVSGSSASNTVTGAIAGVTLTLTGVTASSSPVTVNVAPPAPNAANISNAINAFVTQYNKVITDIQTQLSTKPSSTDPTVGTLYNDPQLKALLAQMRTSMYTPGAGLPTGLATMMDIGVSTGSTTGSGAVSSSALNGDLTLNSTTLTTKLQTNPSGVKAVLGAWSGNFVTLVNNASAPAGTISTRISTEATSITHLGSQIASMQSALKDKQAQLVQQFAHLEGALSSNQSTSSWLASQLAQLPVR